MQVLLVTYGGEAFHTTALSWDQHLVCALIGSLSLLVGFLLKLLPQDLFRIKMDEKPLEPEEARSSSLALLRKRAVSGTMSREGGEKVQKQPTLKHDKKD